MSEYQRPQIIEEKPRKKPEASPKEELDGLEHAEKQEQEFDLDSLDYKNFDYEKLKDIPEKYHTELILKLLNTGNISLYNFFDNIDKFACINYEKLLMSLINNPLLNYHIPQLFNKFVGIKPEKHKEIYFKLLESIEDEKISSLTWYTDKFVGLTEEDSLEIIDELFKKNKQGLIPEQIIKFKIENTEYEKIIFRILDSDPDGCAKKVAKYINRFPGIDQKKIVDKLIEFKKYRELLENFDNFHQLSEEQVSFIFLNVIAIDKPSLITSEYSRSFVNRKNISNLVAEKLIETGSIQFVIENLDKFKDINIDFFFKIYEKIKTSKSKFRDFTELFDSFKIFNISKDEDFNKIAEKMILDGEIHILIQHLENFKGLNNNIFNKILETNCETHDTDALIFLERFKNFEKLDHKAILYKILNSTENAKSVSLEVGLLKNLHKLSNLTEADHKELVLWLINNLENKRKFFEEEKHNGFWFNMLYESIFKNLDSFLFFGEENLIKLIDLKPDYFKYKDSQKHIEVIFKNIKKLKLGRKTLLKLIELGYIVEVTSNINKFSGLDKEISLKLIEAGESDSITKNLEKFTGLDKEVILKLIEAGQRSSVVRNLEKFTGLDKEVVLKFIEIGLAAYIPQNLEKFTGLKTEEHKEVALKLIETKNDESVIENLEKFIGLKPEDHKEITLKLIEVGKGFSVARNLEKLFGLDKEVALKLIEAGQGWCIALNPEKFIGLDKEILFKIINTKEFGDIKNKLDHFDLSEKIQIKDFTVLSSYSVDDSLDFLKDYIEDEVFKQGFSDNQIAKNLFVDEWAHTCQKYSGLNFEEIKKVMFKAKGEQIPNNLQEEDSVAFRELSDIFGAEALAKFIKLKDRSYFHIAQNSIVKLYQASGLSPEKFSANILFQVSDDTSNYNGFDSFDFLNTLGSGIKSDMESAFQEARGFSNPELLKLVGEMENQGPFTNWKFLKKYYELCQILNQREILEKLEILKKENRLKQYEFFSKLAFHPNINSQAVFDFMETPEKFLDIGDQHSGESHNRKKPTNYLDFPHLDITAENLRNALVEGRMDGLQFFKESKEEYLIPQEDYTDIEIAQMLENRLEKIKNEVINYSELGKQIQPIIKKYNFNVKEFLSQKNISMDKNLKSELETALFGEFGLKRKYDEYIAIVHPKSSPDGHVAGNDTACCMPFGSGKNNVYMYNLGCAVLTIQKKIGDDKFRTVAQSVLTPDVDIKQNVNEIKSNLLSERNKIHEVIKEDLSKKNKIIITADNIEVAHNFKENNKDFNKILKFIYQDFFNNYVKQMASEQNLDVNKLVIGKGFTDALTNLPSQENTFVPVIPPGYSDNTHEECYILDFKSENIYSGAKKQGFKMINRENNQSKTDIKLDKGVRLLTAQDTLQVSYLEGKIYADNESLIQYIHRIGNELIAKDINNELKDRSNLSIAVEDSKGTMEGYIIAYEGVGEKKQHYRSSSGYYDEDDNWIENGDYKNDYENVEEITDDENNRCIYVSDLAAKPEAKLAGGKLLKSFATLIEENYLKKGNPIPILAEARDQTSYPIIAKQINKLGNKYGYTYEMEEMGDYENGTDTMHRVVLRPKKIKK